MLGFRLDEIDKVTILTKDMLENREKIRFNYERTFCFWIYLLFYEESIKRNKQKLKNQDLSKWAFLGEQIVLKLS